jgi:hypothetical protein
VLTPTMDRSYPRELSSLCASERIFDRRQTRRKRRACVETITEIRISRFEDVHRSQWIRFKFKIGHPSYPVAVMIVYVCIKGTLKERLQHERTLHSAFYNYPFITQFHGEASIRIQFRLIIVLLGGNPPTWPSRL